MRGKSYFGLQLPQVLVQRGDEHPDGGGRGADGEAALVAGAGHVAQAFCPHQLIQLLVNLVKRENDGYVSFVKTITS